MSFIPFTGRSFKGSLNTVRYFLTSDCRGKWSMLLSTAVPAAGEALWVLLVPSPSEVVENYLHPRYGRSEHKARNRPRGRNLTGRTGRQRWWRDLTRPDLGGGRGWLSTDIDEMVARAIPGSRFFRGRFAQAQEQWFWRGIDTLDRALFWWMLLDIGENFIHHWASGIVEQNVCSSDFNRLLDADWPGAGGGAINGLWDDSADISYLVNDGYTAGGDDRFDHDATPPLLRGTAVLTVSNVEWENFDTADSTVTPGIFYLDDDGNAHKQDGTTVELPNRNKANHVKTVNDTISISFAGATTIGGYWATPGGVIGRNDGGQCSMTIYANAED